MATSITNRNDSFFSIQKKQFENCLLPLWIYGQATQQEVAETLRVPINEVTGRFNRSLKDGLIHVYYFKPTKLNQRTKKHNTNYVLTDKGKTVVRERMALVSKFNEAV